jgi:two-component system NtrC family sensor kinase
VSKSGGPVACRENRVQNRLAFKLIVSLTVLVAVVQGISTLVTIRIQEQEMLKSMVLGADQLSRSISSATWHAMLSDNRETAYQVMQTIATKQGIDHIRIFNKEGRVMFSTDPQDVVVVNKQDEACFLCHSQQTPLVRVNIPSRSRIFRGPEGSRRLGMVTPIYNEPSCSEAACHAHPSSLNVLGVLDVVLDLDPVDRDLAAMRQRAAAVLAAQVVLITLFIILFIRRFVHRPVNRLIAATRDVMNMRLDQPITLHSSRDLDQLAMSFDVMRGRLKQSMDGLNDLTQTLETRVQERTLALQVTQQKLLQADRLASLGQLSASVAHEINNPVSGVLNLGKLMQRIMKDDGIPPHRVEEFRGYLAQVVTETARVGRIVSDLLSFARRSKPRRGAVDLNEVIRNTLSLVAHKLQLASVRLETDLPDDLPAVLCDGSQIQQVLINLILNAAEAIPGEGTVRVTTRRAAEGTSVVVEVHDTGTCIPPDLIPRIFDPFFTTKEEGQGVGLGLAVAYGIVSAHGGEIEVDSAPGSGTTFRVILPITTADNGRAPASTDSARGET